jgi:phytoene/squalene synthetase
VNTSPLSPSDPRSATEANHCWADSGTTALFPAATRFLPGDLSDSIQILGDYAAALRAIADHPALDNARKEARLKAIADVIEGTEAPRHGEGDEAVRATLTLRHLIEGRELDLQYAWRMLQAAGQDIHKNTYPDWSDLLTWCKFWVAPMGRMAYQIAGGQEGGAEKAESFAIAVELLFLIEQASTHYRWLGRVYLPTRWFRDNGVDPTTLGQTPPDQALIPVFARALEEAGRLLDSSQGIHQNFPTRRLRIAAAIAYGEARSWAASLARANPPTGAHRPGRGTRHRVILSGIWRGMRS